MVSDFESPLENPLAPHERWMYSALEQARRAFEIEEVPIGAIVVHQDEIIGEGYNQRETLSDPTAHAEMIAITQAAQALGDWRLSGCTLYVTLEPCPMCAGAIVNARVPQLIYGCGDPKAGAVRTLYQLCDDPRLNHRVNITPGIQAEECAKLLQDFFKAQRALGKK